MEQNELKNMKRTQSEHLNLRFNQSYLSQVQSDGDPVELTAIFDARALPPLVRAVDGVSNGMLLCLNRHKHDLQLS